jgi:hypothetical protein
VLQPDAVGVTERELTPSARCPKRVKCIFIGLVVAQVAIAAPGVAFKMALTASPLPGWPLEFRGLHHPSRRSPFGEAAKAAKPPWLSLLWPDPAPPVHRDLPGLTSISQDRHRAEWPRPPISSLYGWHRTDFIAAIGLESLSPPPNFRLGTDAAEQSISRTGRP